MKEIPLTQGKVALVDDDVYEILKQYKWCAAKKKKTFYAIRGIKKENGKPTTIRMHRYILELSGTHIEPHDITDHKNGDGLDNTQDNLRIVTNRQNLQNMRTNKTGFPGVSYHKPNGKYRAWARIGKDWENKYLGCYDTAKEAYDAYCSFLDANNIPYLKLTEIHNHYDHNM